VSGMIGRRQFVATLAGAAAWPLTANAQQTSRISIVGFLSPNSAEVAAPWTAAFVKRLRELGWTEKQNIQIEYRWQDGRVDRTAESIDELVALKSAVIVTHGVANILAAKQASAIPVVFALASDPVLSGFVESLSRPGGNATGLSILARDLAGKRLELMREMLPRLWRLAVMGDPAGALELKEAQAAAQRLGFEATALEINRPEDIAPAIRTVAGRADALYVCATPLVNTNRQSINSAALAARLPTMQGFREAVEAGALMSYGPNFPDLFRRAADFVDKILRGAKVADIPVEQPTKFELIINLSTAKQIGVTIPSSVLARADRVIR